MPKNQIPNQIPRPTSYQSKSSEKIAKVALFGLPNAGKSSFLNRVSNTEAPNYKKAVVAKEAGTTRDVNTGDVEWGGYFFSISDTGGLVPDAGEKITKAIQIKTWASLASADLLIWLIDRKQDPQTISEKILNKVWKLGKPYIVAINKVDDPNYDASVADYAFLGGLGFVNVSCNTGYGLGDLMDMVVDELQKQGFGPNTKPKQYEVKDKVLGKRDRQKIVEKATDGNYYIARGQDGLFESFGAEVSQDESREIEKNPYQIDNLVFDLSGVVFGYQLEEFQNWLKTKLKLDKTTNLLSGKTDGQLNLPAIVSGLRSDSSAEEISRMIQNFKNQKDNQAENQIGGLENKDFRNLHIQKAFEEQSPINSKVLSFMIAQKQAGKKLFYLSNLDVKVLREQHSNLFDLFDGGLDATSGFTKPSPEIFLALQDKIANTNSNFAGPMEFDPAGTCIIDDNNQNLLVANELGYKNIHYQGINTDLDTKLAEVEKRELDYPKILFLGRPNVGKSSLFNTLAGQELQIVTEIAGTTLGVNDTLIEKPKTKSFESQKPKYLVFDFDGVLADSLEAVIYANMKVNKTNREDAITFNLDWIQQKPTWSKKITKAEHNKELKRNMDFFEHCKEVEIPLFEGFLDQIIEVENANLAIVSSAVNYYIKDKVEQISESWGLHFDKILGAEDHHSKVEKILELCNHWDCEPADILYFTDTPRDFLELKEFLPETNIYGCAWGWAGAEILAKYLPEEQILVEFEDIHTALQNHNFTSRISYTDFKKYLILDSAGIRRTGQRTLGAETFATYHTIEAAHKADVILLVLDGSTPPTHQDQVVAGIAQEAKKGIVVVINKADLVEVEERNRYIKKLQSKFQFLKAGRVIWVSAESGEGLEKILHTVDLCIADRQKELSREEVRKLFNFLMKQKPPNKQKLQKRPVIYDLLYSSSNPPTFQLLIKKKKTLHWSYLRFLENIIRKNFGFENTEIKVKAIEVDRKMIVGS